MNSPFVAQFYSYKQYAPDGSCETVVETMVVTEQTTVGELLDWWRKRCPRECIEFTGPIHITAAMRATSPPPS